MVEAIRENYDYSAINQRLNRRFDPYQFVDFRNIENAERDYDSKKSPTENIEAFLAEKIYGGDAQKANHHAYDVFHAIHEQTIQAGYERGFNDFANVLRSSCARIKISDGRILFFDAEGNILANFEAASTLRTDLRDRVVERSALRQEVDAQKTRAVAKEALQNLLPEFPHAQLDIPDFQKRNFRFAPSFFRNTGAAPLLLDERRSGETVCAGYITEVLRYYVGSGAIQSWGIQGLDAWELKEQLLQKGVVTNDVSMNNFFKVENGRPVFSHTVRQSNGSQWEYKGNEAKETVYYSHLYRRVYGSIAATSSPLGLITLYFHGTGHNADIVRANQKNGAESFNSHVVLNLGEEKKDLQLGSFNPLIKLTSRGPQDPLVRARTLSSPPEEEKPVKKVVMANFPKAKSHYHWAFLDGKSEISEGKSRVYLNGEQLLYRGGEFLHEDGTEAMVRENDRLEWEDIFVMDRFYKQNRIVGLTELMLTGDYDVVDALGIKPESLPPERRLLGTPTPFLIQSMFYLLPGQTLEDALRKKGAVDFELPYHAYAYERAGVHAHFIRPFDPVPFFEINSIISEVEQNGGLAAALAKTRQEQAAEFGQNHPGENLLVIQAGESPNIFARRILELPLLQSLGKLTDAEKQYILTVIVSANKNLGIEIAKTGRIINNPYRFNAGETVTVPDTLLEAVILHITQRRLREMAYIPSDLPGGETFQAPHFTSAESSLIERASAQPAVRIALALILSMEQKQTVSDAVDVRKMKKAAAEFFGLRNRSLGLFQVRLQPNDMKDFEISYEDLRKKTLDDDETNASLAVRRVEENMRAAEYFFSRHGETFDPKNEGCMAYILNCYHAAPAKVLLNIFHAWGRKLEENLGLSKAEGADQITADGVKNQFQKIAEALQEHGIVDITYQETSDGLKALTSAKDAFLSSSFLRKIEAWFSGKTGEKLSLAIPASVVDRKDIATPFLNYGIRATRYGTLQAIETYSETKRPTPTPPPETFVAQKS